MQQDFPTSGSNLNPTDSEAINRLWSVLAELNIVQGSEIESSIALETLPDAIELASCEEIATLQEEIFSDSLEVCSENQVVASIVIVSQSERSAIEPASQILTLRSEPSSDAVEAFERLQSLMVDSKLVDLHQSTDALRQKLEQLVNQIHEPDQLIALLLPHIAEILKCKVTESQEEMVSAIAPIIDQAIQRRGEQDQNQMGTALAPAIPDAIAQKVKVSPDMIAEAIAPTMGQAIKRQIQIEQDAIVDALYPIIGGTISKYLAETVRAINEQIENTLSVEGIKRKIVARVKGVSEAELILKEALPLKIQAAFLIHKTSGLIIAEMQNTDEQQLDSDMIAGMLTAIRSFANDCIAQTGQTSELNKIDYGSSKILLEVAGYCYLAIVIQGEPTQSFIHQVRQIFSKLIQQEGNAIAAFDGNYDKVPTAILAMLQDLRQVAQSNQSSSKKPPIVGILAAGLLVLIGIPWGIALDHGYLRQRIENAIATTPELAIYHLEVEVQFSKLKLTGRLPNVLLQKRAEQVTRETLPHWSIENAITVVDIPPDPILTAAEVSRVTHVLNQVPSIAISANYQAEQVTIQGTVTQANEVRKIAQAYRQIPGVKSVISAIQVRPLIQELRLYFAVDSTKLRQSTDEAEKLKLFLQQHPQSRFRVIGYSNELKIASARAKAVQALLIQQGIAPSRTQIDAFAQAPPNVDSTQSDELRRCAIVTAIPEF